MVSHSAEVFSNKPVSVQMVQLGQIETAIFNLTPCNKLKRQFLIWLNELKRYFSIWLKKKLEFSFWLRFCQMVSHGAEFFFIKPSLVFKLFNLINNWNGNFHLTEVSSSKYIVPYSAEVSSMKPVLSKWFNLSKLIKVKPQISIWLAVIWFPTTLIRVSPV